VLDTFGLRWSRREAPCFYVIKLLPTRYRNSCRTTCRVNCTAFSNLNELVLRYFLWICKPSGQAQFYLKEDPEQPGKQLVFVCYNIDASTIDRMHFLFFIDKKNGEVYKYLVSDEERMKLDPLKCQPSEWRTSQQGSRIAPLPRMNEQSNRLLLLPYWPTIEQ
jgi:hypothetical protein